MFLRALYGCSLDARTRIGFYYVFVLLLFWFANLFSKYHFGIFSSFFEKRSKKHGGTYEGSPHTPLAVSYADCGALLAPFLLGLFARSALLKW